MQEVLKLLEVYRVLGRLALKSVDQGLELMVRVDTTLLDVIEKLMLEKIPTVLTIKRSESTACPGGRCAWCGSGGLLEHLGLLLVLVQHSFQYSMRSELGTSSPKGKNG